MSKVPLKYFLYANLPICLLGLALQYWKPPLQYAMPIAAFQIAFGVVLVWRGLVEWKALRAATRNQGSA